jgi:hypothetical protein
MRMARSSNACVCFIRARSHLVEQLHECPLDLAVSTLLYFTNILLLIYFTPLILLYYFNILNQCLVEQLHECPLDLAVSTRALREAPPADGIDLGGEGGWFSVGVLSLVFDLRGQRKIRCVSS